MSLILSGTEGISGSAGVIDAETFAGQANTYYTDISARLGYTPLSNVNPNYSGTLTGNTGIINIGSGQIYKDASGNVGIDTATPAYRLQVRRAGGAGSLGISVDGVGSVNRVAQYFAVGDSTSVTTGHAFYTRNGTATDNLAALIDSSGNVGIGTSSPAGKLDVKDSIYLTNDSNNSMLFGRGTYFGYSSTYRAVQIGATSGFFTVAIGYDPSTNLNGSFNGNGSEIVVRNGARFITPNATNDNWHTTLTLKDGNVGIGTISPVRRLVVSKGGAEGVEIGPGDTVGDPAGAVSFVYYNRSSSAYIQNIQDSSLHLFKITGSEMLRINSGDVSIGKTAASETYSTGNGFGFAASKVDPFFSVVNVAATGGNACIYLNKRNLNSSNGLLSFLTNNGSSQSGVGSITHNGTNTSFNTSSDYRLKNIEGILTNSGSYIDSLRPVHGTWKVNGRKFIGLIAHEAQEVSQTDVATGEKDGKDMQAMDYSNSEFIANIIAELQSLRKRVAELESLKQ